MRLAALLAAILPACASATAGSESVIGEVGGAGWTRYACEWDPTYIAYRADIGAATANPPPIVQVWFVPVGATAAFPNFDHYYQDGGLTVDEDEWAEGTACIVYVWK